MVKGCARPRKASSHPTETPGAGGCLPAGTDSAASASETAFIHFSDLPQVILVWLKFLDFRQES